MFMNMFNTWDFAYLFNFHPWHSEEPIEELVEFVEKGIIKPCKVLDIGCGLATNTIYLASKGFEAYGLDISKVAILKAIKRAKSRNLNIKFYNLDFTEYKEVKKLGYFDLAIDIGCYHSLTPGIKRINYLKSLNSILVKNGKFLLWCFTSKDSWKGGPPGVSDNEIEEYFKNYKIIEKREIKRDFRNMFFYFLEKLNS